MMPLCQAIREYLALRRSVGYRLDYAATCLAQFAAFLEQRGAEVITVALALEWALAGPPVQPSTWARRLSFVRGFARHWCATDPRTEVPPCGLLPSRARRARPHLYTAGEIQQLLAAAQALPPLRGRTYACVFGLLAATGLRIGEALALTPDDVDLRAGILTIRRAKFGKSRLVPVHPSTQRALRAYARQRAAWLAGRAAPTFFVSDRGRRLARAVVRRVFGGLCRQIGLRDPSATRGPRLHDFRHRFAVETLVRWYRAGEDAERRLPVLATYLGHAHVTGTYWYLSTCPELLRLACARLVRRWEVQP
jgi:integrase